MNHDEILDSHSLVVTPNEVSSRITDKYRQSDKACRFLKYSMSVGKVSAETKPTRTLPSPVKNMADIHVFQHYILFHGPNLILPITFLILIILT